MEIFLKCFLLWIYWILLFSKERDFWSFSSFLFFCLCSFFSFFCALSLYWGWTRGFLKCLRSKQFSSQLSFKWGGSGYTNIYEIGGVAENLSTVDAYPRMDLCTPIIFFGMRLAAKFREGKSFWKIQKLNENTSLNKAQREQVLLRGIYLALVGMYMLSRNLCNSTLNNFIIKA
jgi:hypothetical protein